MLDLSYDGVPLRVKYADPVENRRREEAISQRNTTASEIPLKSHIPILKRYKELYLDGEFYPECHEWMLRKEAEMEKTGMLYPESMWSRREYVALMELNLEKLLTMEKACDKFYLTREVLDETVKRVQDDRGEEVLYYQGDVALACMREHGGKAAWHKRVRPDRTTWTSVKRYVELTSLWEAKLETKPDWREGSCQMVKYLVENYVFGRTPEFDHAEKTVDLMWKYFVLYNSSPEFLEAIQEILDQDGDGGSPIWQYISGHMKLSQRTERTTQAR